MAPFGLIRRESIAELLFEEKAWASLGARVRARRIGDSRLYRVSRILKTIQEQKRGYCWRAPLYFRKTYADDERIDACQSRKWRFAGYYVRSRHVLSCLIEICRDDFIILLYDEIRDGEKKIEYIFDR